MNKKPILFLIILILLIDFYPTKPIIGQETDNWVIDGDTVYIDDDKVYASATPHTISDGEVVFEFESKQYSGDIDFAWGFNQEIMKPKNIWLWQNISHPFMTWYSEETWGCKNIHNVISYENLGIENYEYYNVALGTANNTYLFKIFYYDSSIDDYDWMVCAFTEYEVLNEDTYQLCGYYDKKIKTWDNQSYYDWKEWDVGYNHIQWAHDGMTDWYVTPSVSVDAWKRYKCKIEMERTQWFIGEASGKYWFVFKPSSMTLQEAKDTGNLYALDPWWDSDYSYAKFTPLSNVVTDWKLRINVTKTSGGDANCSGHCQDDFGDIRFVKSDNTTALDYYLQDYVSGQYAYFWVNISNEATGLNMYYGTTGATVTTSEINTTWDGYLHYNYENYSDGTEVRNINLYSTEGNDNDEEIDDGDLGSVYEHNKIMVVKDDSASSNQIDFDYNFEQDQSIIYVAMMADDDETSFHTSIDLVDSGSNWLIRCRIDEEAGLQTYDGAWHTDYVFGAEQPDVWYNVRIRFDVSGANTDVWVTWYDEFWTVLSAESAYTTIGSSSNAVDKISFLSYEAGHAGLFGYYDFFVGNVYCTTYPSIGGWSGEFLVNQIPMITTPIPANTSTNIDLIPTLNITVNEPDGETMNITWYSNSSGVWLPFGTNTSINDGTYHQTNTNFSCYNTTYYWNVSVNDGTDVNDSDIFYFTTRVAEITMTSENPTNNTVDFIHYNITNQNFTITVNNTWGDIFAYINISLSNETKMAYHNFTNVGNGTYWLNWSSDLEDGLLNLSYSTTYRWYVNASSNAGCGFRNHSWYEFTTSAADLDTQIAYLIWLINNMDTGGGGGGDIVSTPGFESLIFFVSLCCLLIYILYRRKKEY